MLTDRAEYLSTAGWAGRAHQLACDGRKASACLKYGSTLAVTEMLVTEPMAAPFPDCIFETAEVKACLLQ